MEHIQRRNADEISNDHVFPDCFEIMWLEISHPGLMLTIDESLFGSDFEGNPWLVP